MRHTTILNQELNICDASSDYLLFTCNALILVHLDASCHGIPRIFHCGGPLCLRSFSVCVKYDEGEETSVDIAKHA